MTDPFATIATLPTRIAAELAVAQLEGHGIAALAAADDVGGAYPWLEAHGVRVRVRVEDAEPARRVLAEPAPAESEIAFEEDAAGAESSQLTAEPVPPPPGHIGIGAALLLVTFGGIVGFSVSEFRVLERPNNPGVWIAPDERDQNRDGRVDDWVVFRGGVAVRRRTDRNFDGKPDVWQFYRDDGLPRRSESDDDFDGRPDALYHYRAGDVVEARYDLDGNGVKDESCEHVHGVVTRCVLHPNGGAVEREWIYRNGQVREERLVSPGGEPTLLRAYDEFGRALPLAQRH